MSIHAKTESGPSSESYSTTFEPVTSVKTPKIKVSTLIDQAIKRLKPFVSIGWRETEDFICPISLEVFREPVIDEHGHTFEKRVIEEALKRKNECPISRQPIHKLTPNRLIQKTLEERKRNPIPNLSLFQKENRAFACSHIQLANQYVEEGEYGEALDAYAKAFQYTKDWHDYVNIPLLFEKMGETQNATLAYLYLSQYQIEDGKLSEAIETLEKCQQKQQEGNSPNLIIAYLQIDLLLVRLYDETNLIEKATMLTQKTIEKLNRLSQVCEERPKEKLQIYQTLFQFEQKSKYCQHIITCYEKLNKLQKQIEWYCTYLSLLIEEQQWHQAEEVALQAIKKATNETQEIQVYEHLEIIYTHWNEKCLEELWDKLAKCYQKTNRLAAAEEIYKKAFQKFHKLEHILGLADTLKNQQKIRESVQAYYEAAAQALLENKSDRLAYCIQMIQSIDPNMQELDTNQKISLLSARALQTTRSELHHLQKRIDDYTEVLKGERDHAYREEQSYLKMRKKERYGSNDYETANTRFYQEQRRGQKLDSRLAALSK